MGNELFDEVAELTGLPKALIQEELTEILARLGSSPESMTMEDLKQALSLYLKDLNSKMKTV